MAMFDIDDPNIDVAALEARVKAAIEAKRGVRFTDEELDELRSAELTPRLRREDLPRGFVSELSAARDGLPEITPPPGCVLDFDPAGDAASGGPKGAVLRLLRAVAKPFYRATLDLNWLLTRLGGELAEKISDQGSWTGRQLSDMTAQLDRQRDRDLHLFHNMVQEITALRLQQIHMQDRVNELIRELDALRERERVLESLTVKESRPVLDRDA
jgi:hypothetical protein